MTSITIDLEHLPRSRRAADIAQRWLAWDAPALPDVPTDALRRWSTAVGWAPPGTRALQRFVNLGTLEYRVSYEPLGDDWLPDRTIGLLHTFAQPGTTRLVRDGEHFATTTAEGGLQEGIEALGFVEQAAFPMLDPIQRRRHMTTGQEVLVSGADDPLLAESELIEQVGFVDHFPVRPFPAEARPLSWGWGLLFRRVDRESWQHVYEVRAAAGDDDGTCLGRVAIRPQPRSRRIEVAGGVPQLPDGLGAAVSSAPADTARWLLAPARWASEVGEPSTKLVRERLAWLRAGGSRLRANGDGSSSFFLGGEAGDPPLYAAVHPVTDDVYLSRSAAEAADMGYRVLGVLGHAPAAAEERAGQDEVVPWASRLGQGRRTVVGD